MSAAEQYGAPEPVVQRLLAMVRAGRAAGPGLPTVADPAWLDAPAVVVAGTLARASLGWLATASEVAIRERLAEEDRAAAVRWRTVAYDMADGLPWSQLPEVRVPLVELQRRRAGAA